MKEIWNWIKKEISIKIDFVNDEYELGYLWLVWILIMIICYSLDIVNYFIK